MKVWWLVVGLMSACAEADSESMLLTDWVARETLRIDGAESDLVPISSVALMPDGTLAVAQSQDSRVLFFDDSGQRIGAVGRRGSGPGEFRRITRIGLVGNRLWVLDSGLGRVVLVDAQHLDQIVTQNLPVESGISSGAEAAGGALSPYAMYEDGAILSTSFSAADAVRMIKVAGASVFEIATIRRLEQVARITIEGAVISADLFGSAPSFAASPHGNYVVVAAQIFPSPGRVESDSQYLSVDLFDAHSADTLYSTQIAVPGVEIPRPMADSAILARAQRLPPSVATVFKNKVVVPRFFPPVTGAYIDDRAQAWLRFAPGPDQTQVYGVLDKRGQLRAEVAFPRNSVIVAIRESIVWCLETNEDDVQSLVRYEIVHDSF